MLDTSALLNCSHRKPFMNDAVFGGNALASPLDLHSWPIIGRVSPVSRISRDFAPLRRSLAKHRLREELILNQTQMRENSVSPQAKEDFRAQSDGTINQNGINKTEERAHVLPGREILNRAKTILLDARRGKKIHPRARANPPSSGCPLLSLYVFNPTRRNLISTIKSNCLLRQQGNI